MTDYQLYQIRMNQIIDSILGMLESGRDAIGPTILLSAVPLLIYFVLIKKKMIRSRKMKEVVFLIVYTVFLMELTIFSRMRVGYFRINIIPFTKPGGAHLLILYSFVNMVFFIPIGIVYKMIRSEDGAYSDVIIFGGIVSSGVEIAQLIMKCGEFQTEDILMNVLGTIFGWWFYEKVLSKKVSDKTGEIID